MCTFEVLHSSYILDAFHYNHLWEMETQVVGVYAFVYTCTWDILLESKVEDCWWDVDERLLRVCCMCDRVG